MNLKRLLLLINICLAGLILWTASSIYMTWRSSKGEKELPPGRTAESGSTVKATSGRPKKQKDYRIIVYRDIFDTAKEAPRKKQKKIAKVTKLALKLKGTVTGGKRNSYAIIEDGTTMKEELYSLNDFVQGARIVQILHNQVILNLKGVREILIMTEETSPSAPRISPRKRVKAPKIKPRKRERPKRPKI